MTAEQIDFEDMDSGWVVQTSGTTRHVFLITEEHVMYRRLPGPDREDWQGSHWERLLQWSPVVVGGVFRILFDRDPANSDFWTRRSSTVRSIQQMAIREATNLVTEWERSQ